MINDILLTFLLISAVLIVIERKIIRMIIYLAVFSLLASLCFFFAAAPDVAMAEAVVSVMTTVIFIVALEKYFKPVKEKKSRARGALKLVTSVAFTGLLLALFLAAAPDTMSNPRMKLLYASLFQTQVGGENAVTAIYLGYRVYDTLFEALLLLMSVTAVIHISRHKSVRFETQSRHYHIPESDVALGTIRLVCPILIVFGLYLIFNGHMSAGGGFQGGVVIAAFFVCRYLIFDISDLRIKTALTAEKLIYALLILTASAFLLFTLPVPQNVYLITMNALIGVKVACGFVIIFYRFVTFERS